MKYMKIKIRESYNLLAVLFVFLFLFIVFTQSHYQKKGFEMNILHFDSTKIEGVLKYQNYSNKGIAIKIERIKKKLFFYPNDKKNLSFHILAEKGDSIYKPAFADTLKLIKGDKVYKYTFSIPSNRKRPK